MSEMHVYRFGPNMTDGKADMKNLLGGKGANLAEMSLLDIPVPPGCTITTEVCTFFNENGKTYPKELDGQLKNALKDVEDRVGAVFGDSENPSVSVQLFSEPLSFLRYEPKESLLYSYASFFLQAEL